MGDGICDCCDGSDEKSHICRNNCKEMAEQEHAAKNAERILWAKGIEVRKQWVSEAAATLQSIREAEHQLTTEIAVKTGELEQAEKRVEEERDLENAEIDRLNAERDARIALKRSTNIGAVTVEVVMDADEKASLPVASKPIETVSEEPSEASSATSEEVVVAAVGEEEEQQQQEKEEEELFPYPAEYMPQEVEEENFPYPAEYAAPGDPSQIDDDIALSETEATISIDQEIDEKEDNNDEEPEVNYESEAKIAAVKERDAIKSKKKSLEQDLKKKQDDLSNNFGPENVYAQMYDQCYSAQFKQYTYEVCPFGSATQKERSSTKLGTFTKWDSDNTEPTMLFEGGAKCWQGPARSVGVTFTCADEVKMLSVEEPSKCVYAIRMSTPAACDPNEFR